MKSLRFSALALCLAAPLAAQTFGGTIPTLAIPDGLGSCSGSPPVSTTVTVPPGYGPASSMTVTIGITHTWYGDVKLTLTSPTGTALELMRNSCDGSLDDSSDLGGQYTFSDTAATTFDAAAAAFSAGAPAVIPPGSYRGDVGLSGALFCGVEGTWTFTFSDGFSSDTGSVNYVAINLTPGTPTAPSPVFNVCQAGPGANMVVVHAGGVPGSFFFNPVVIGTGHTPNGWAFGLDININDLAAQLNAPQGIFFGTLDGSGGHFLSVPVPPGLNFGTGGVHSDPTTGLPTFSSGAFDYTTI